MFYLKGILEEMKQGKESVENIVEQLEQHEPETPEPTASTKLISHGSPEQSNEKKEEPSPVSVLESFFDDIGSSNGITFFNSSYP
jgi:antitoxin component HigA of HigAB toxin-antitoxin module